MGGPVRVSTHPSLALIKYWGKLPGGVNIPATTSIAVGLDELSTVSEIRLIEGESRLEIDGRWGDLKSLAPFSEELSRHGIEAGIEVRSTNSFPGSAGLASSSSGFAALALGIAAAAELSLSLPSLSSLARLGSGSAARAVYGGFTRLEAGSEAAEQLYPPDYWPDLRVGIGIVTDAQKETSSREGMNRARETSPYYPAWIDSNHTHVREAEEALRLRDLERLGEAMRQSYLAMFGTMLSAAPPFIYWRPESVAILHALEGLRAEGFSVWETMDAGPQVKFLTTANDLPQVEARLKHEVPGVRWLSSRIGGEPRIEKLSSREEPARKETR